MNTAKVTSISTSRELELLIDRAKSEEWQQLMLLGPDAKTYLGWYLDRISGHVEEGGTIYHTTMPVPDLASKLSVLTGLRLLNLQAQLIGDEGARHLAGLTGLTWLDLSYNNLTDEGAEAVVCADRPYLPQSWLEPPCWCDW